jgi:hypothetical protein
VNEARTLSRSACESCLALTDEQVAEGQPLSWDEQLRLLESGPQDHRDVQRSRLLQEAQEELLSLTQYIEGNLRQLADRLPPHIAFRFTSHLRKATVMLQPRQPGDPEPLRSPAAVLHALDVLKRSFERTMEELAASQQPRANSASSAEDSRKA